jgi:hypothetical protein
MFLSKLRKCFHKAVPLAIISLMWGCGDGGGTASDITPVTGPAVSVVSSGNGEYAIKGQRMDGVAGIKLTISYDSSILSFPSVIQGGLVSGALMATNTSIPGTVIIAVISTTPFSGDGQIATVSFATQNSSAAISIDSVQMYDITGKQLNFRPEQISHQVSARTT